MQPAWSTCLPPARPQPGAGCCPLGSSQRSPLEVKHSITPFKGGLLSKIYRPSVQHDGDLAISPKCFSKPALHRFWPEPGTKPAPSPPEDGCSPVAQSRCLAPEPQALFSVIVIQRPSASGSLGVLSTPDLPRLRFACKYVAREEDYN